MSSGIKDGWDKAQIILSPVGGLLTAVAVALIGFQLNARQAEDTKAKFYADLMGKREEADTSLRKDMSMTVALTMFTIWQVTPLSGWMATINRMMGSEISRGKGLKVFLSEVVFLWRALMKLGLPTETILQRVFLQVCLYQSEFDVLYRRMTRR